MKRLIALALLLSLVGWLFILPTSVDGATLPSNGGSLCGQHWAIGTMDESKSVSAGVTTIQLDGTMTTTGHGGTNRYCGPMAAGVTIHEVGTETIKAGRVVGLTLVESSAYGTLRYSYTATARGDIAKVTGFIGQ